MTVRPSVPGDAESIARLFLESAEHHAGLDPERYFVPDLEWIAARYRDGSQHPRQPPGEAVTLVAEAGGQILGFVDAQLERPLDAMHRDTIYCHIAEIAVHSGHRSQGIGEQLLRAAEEWGRARGAEYASLEYHAANTRAAQFYQDRLGYWVASSIAIRRL